MTQPVVTIRSTSPNSEDVLRGDVDGDLIGEIVRRVPDGPWLFAPCDGFASCAYEFTYTAAELQGILACLELRNQQP